MLASLSMRPVYWWIAAASIASAGWIGWTVNGWRLQSRIDTIRAEHAALRAEASRRTAQAQAEQRAIEAQRQAAQQEITHAANLARTRDDADRRAADAAGQRLLDAARAAAARAGGACADPSAAAEREATAGPVRALEDVLGEVRAEAGILAAAVDAARTAGLACEQHADSLTRP